MHRMPMCMFILIIVCTTIGLIGYKMSNSSDISKNDMELCQLPLFHMDQTYSGLAYLQSRKRHEIATIVGTGMSTGAVTSTQANLLHEISDIWGMNQMFFHEYIVPDFYHVEMASVKGTTNSDLWQYFDTNRRTKYTYTTFVTSEHSRKSMYEVLCRKPEHPLAMITYSMKKRQKHYSCTPSGFTNMGNRIYTSNIQLEGHCGGATITYIIDILIKMKYKQVAFIGVDLNEITHFYTYHPFVMNTSSSFEQHILTLDRKRVGSNIHATGARGVHLFIDRVAELFTHIKFVNLSPFGKLASLTHVVTMPLHTYILSNLTSH
ncbi:hypothetical protein EhV422 [Emiliania huxleyi virus 86]|uniref:Putative membrane protein n=2 Tax=Emiliania huxleyi virus 86 TaxID=181082 RepID=Q4A257_EHV8U|nr:hypothetical protein EhV422 [Emiliania huxleyi virus 86]AHA55041.1 putative membrane protein [Emiliania huxleyi virus 145]AHA56049.1 putative membrane protein [Emiliania huxleyi virus 164]UKZ11448.1 hypothetical protein EhVM1_000433 [Emiliania huxleyi virus M1]CAI65849.1 putative membrane protein [Emiliania huxleyi virus 86]|mmetsp:Transcript_22819/g.65194  ORF Transcript_22819/g.65194 Transcript_22819/m.65194 type:complete len:320 (+) Transcript_22819:5479-6438(+)